MIIRVEDFGKIKSATVNLDGYTIFVGDNNSGKTYLMQLIYGTLEALKRIQFTDSMSNLPNVKATQVKTIVNKWLQEKKDTIVHNTFKKKIPINLIEILFPESEDIFSVKKLTKEEYCNLTGENVPFLRETNENFQIFSIFVNDSIKSSFFGFDASKGFMYSEMIRFAVGRLLKIKNIRHSNNIFLPASRSGLMLTRPFVFANKNEEGFVSTEEFSSEKRKENELGLTQPVYDFLSFLQTHKSSENETNKSSALISFINENIIHGEMKKTDNESFYKPEGTEEWLSPSVTSSMVNEISPILQILTSVRRFQYIFYDEIETCQHPTTQIQMARLLNRMVNAGYKMVVSTHSDTMAAAINNAISIEKLKNSNEILKKLGYEKKDILVNNDLVHAYQFIKSESGTIVEEVKRHPAIGLNFNFTLFNEANKKLFDAYKYLR